MDSPSTEIKSDIVLYIVRFVNLLAFQKRNFYSGRMRTEIVVAPRVEQPRPRSALCYGAVAGSYRMAKTAENGSFQMRIAEKLK